jgi:hypothetical protein
MIKKISREECLKNYPVFPLRHYDETTDEEEFFYPQVISGQWMELGIKDRSELTLKLAKALTGLLRLLNIDQLIFLGDTDQNWISRLAGRRKDYLPFTEAVIYFIEHQINTSFNGGVIVSIDDLEEFLNHFYTLTSCDASLPYFYFIDNNVQILGTIHYSGQIRIHRFSEQAEKLFNKMITDTDFRFVST